ncbi:MAG: U32 family peptidase, partial [Sutterellaceae bacterium]|nr:U32 family peptidase [Sutterellaceae bacterium]
MAAGMLSRDDLELMAPAGSREALMAAVAAGADSVYFGVGKLNMRSGASSAFTVENLPEVAAICREHGVKSYLTVNTVIYDDDIQEMKMTVTAAKSAGIDAIIASDVAVMRFCNEVGVEVH